MAFKLNYFKFWTKFFQTFPKNQWFFFNIICFRTIPVLYEVNSVIFGTIQEWIGIYIAYKYVNQSNFYLRQVLEYTNGLLPNLSKRTKLRISQSHSIPQYWRYCSPINMKWLTNERPPLSCYHLGIATGWSDMCLHCKLELGRWTCRINRGLGISI